MGMLCAPLALSEPAVTVFQVWLCREEVGDAILPHQRLLWKVVVI